MKISQEMRSKLETSPKNVPQAVKGSKSFGTMVESQSQKLKETELHKLMSDLTTQGERLGRSRSFRDLAKYKRMVKNFVKEAVQYGMELKHSHSWNMDGNNRKLTTVENIDKKLVELTEGVLEQEKKPIDILGVIGEIKGLLVNLYT
ncbi:YaaR family protein [Virgibacillus senegalensis]|uniref:YaaR family protein n=1 Tax=Virgibacillus senegalensis TaxID=1499679 RepID=UPI00069E36DC|nr:YaaR family protein [Virgibacillus senegalensis]